MAVDRLDEREIQAQLVNLPGWQREGQALRRTYRFASFRDAIFFVNAVAGLAEDVDHHPDIDVRYNRVTLTLSTHSAGGLTVKDFDLAKTIDRYTARYRT